MLKESVSILFSAEAFDISVKGKISRVVVVFLGRTFWRRLMTSTIVNLRLGMSLRCLL